MWDKLNQICKPPGTFSDDSTRMIRLPRCIPQDVKFKIGRRALVA